MAVQQAEALYASFANALNAGDVPAILMLFEADGQTVPQPGQAPVMGVMGIQEVMEGCVALQPHIQYGETKVIQAGDLALLRGQWRLSVPGPEGKPMDVHGKSAQVARRQADGGWRFVIDDPWDGAW
ncbi:MAG TPA: SgcJ/EcaC family oxidoreductase [Caldilineaceae bacterium]|nr:SgcJ/EcaC family oxidoreductase [Caldilineaceae bacterium]